MDLEDLRKRIDEVDSELIKLLEERASLAKKIGSIKKKQGKKIFSPRREKQILDKLKEQEGHLNYEMLSSIYREIISACRALQEPVKVAYLGPRGSFTHQCALNKFGSQASYVASESIEDVFTSVEQAHSSYGVVPVESSLEGMVTRTLDMFVESQNKITAEKNQPISQCLLSSDRMEKIDTVYSHPQALAQVRGWLRKNLPNVEIKETSSTSEAAKIASEKKAAAAVGSKAAAEIYALDVLEEDIQENWNTVTRFLIISKSDSERTGQDKTSIMFSITDRVGALYEILKPFGEHGINLTKIESRPSKRGIWDYYFFVDFEGHREDENVQKVIEKVEEYCVFLKILGSYPRGE